MLDESRALRSTIKNPPERVLSYLASVELDGLTLAGSLDASLLFVPALVSWSLPTVPVRSVDVSVIELSIDPLMSVLVLPLSTGGAEAMAMALKSAKASAERVVAILCIFNLLTNMVMAS